MRDRVYVRVTSDFDLTGHMQPRSIFWPAGCVFLIEEVRAFSSAEQNPQLDCYIIVIHGRERCLCFECSGIPLDSRLGRRYVKT